MGFRFRKRIKIAPGLALNISKTGVSATLGKPGASVNIGKKGVSGTVGLLGTGLSYHKKIAGLSRKKNENIAQSATGEFDKEQYKSLLLAEYEKLSKPRKVLFVIGSLIRTTRNLISSFFILIWLTIKWTFIGVISVSFCVALFNFFTR